ncbi:MAG: penicillin-binding transpeptidase domain-containing protein [Eubacteriales bacterium]|jgi:peptidoglycan glycosyltransferase|nr:penicillin-binding transpeptidase domain-containing protein [Eubacteriales bacterium]
MINKRIIRVIFMFTLMFIMLIGYMTYFEIFQSEAVHQNPYNKRQWAYEEDITRGSILDRGGVVLAHSQGTERIYSYGPLYSHVIGYNSKIYGKTMLESKYNKYLLGQDILTQVFNLSGDKKVGYDVTLTIDHELQRFAAKRMGGYSGAVVALNPKTGEVLALVSKPDFDPSDQNLVENWINLTESEKFPLLPRATSGLYAPGSTFKIITSAAAVENGLGDEEYMDYGTVKIGNTEFQNYGKKAGGALDLKKAFAISSNTYFCSLGAKLGGEKLLAFAEAFGFNRVFDFDLPLEKSRFPAAKGDEDTAALAIGQGEMLATPMQMAMAAAAVANEGVIMKPHIVKNIKNSLGVTIDETKPQQLYRAMTAQTAEKISQMMVDAVKSGTGTAARISTITVAGKTGTAENEFLGREKNKEHTWFVGFAPAQNPEIVIAVMLEYSGKTGGDLAAPMARDIIMHYFGK